MSERSAKERWAEWALRVGIAGEFFGHGAFALLAAPEFSQILERLFAVDTALAASLLRVFGILDLCIAVLVLVRPLQAVLLWATAWGFLTAIARPLSGLSWWAFVERGTNWAAPLALLLLRGWPRARRDWLA
jgi:hypothetical protein